MLDTPLLETAKNGLDCYVKIASVIGLYWVFCLTLLFTVPYMRSGHILQREDILYTDAYEAMLSVSVPMSEDGDHAVQTTSSCVHVTLLTAGASDNLGSSAAQNTRCHV